MDRVLPLHTWQRADSVTSTTGSSVAGVVGGSALIKARKSLLNAVARKFEIIVFMVFVSQRRF